jgi:hypothetical protein
MTIRANDYQITQLCRAEVPVCKWLEMVNMRELKPTFNKFSKKSKLHFETRTSIFRRLPAKPTVFSRLVIFVLGVCGEPLKCAARLQKLKFPDRHQPKTVEFFQRVLPKAPQV